MWWAGVKVADVYLGTRALVVSGAGAAPSVVKVEGFEAALAAFATWVDTATTRHRIRLWLSGGLCRPFMLPTIPGVSDAAEIANIASTLAAQHTGLTGPCAVFVERAAGDSRAVAVAVARDQLACIHGLAEKYASRLRLVSIRPWWAEVLRHGLLREPGLAALGLQDCDSMTVLTGREPGAFETVATYSPVTDRETAQSVMSRAMLAADAADGAELVGRLALGEDLESAATAAFALAALTVFSR